MFSIFFASAVFICITSQVKAYDEFKVIKTSNGEVRGLRNTTLFKNIPFYSYKGIPYAKPPIGELRFKAPEPVESWNGILDAFDHGDMCIQPSIFWPVSFSQSENCLTLNIYVPAEVKTNEKLAVLFFIHGGGFTDGSYHDDVYGPDFLLEKETILVTINYRLGLLGFLSLDTPEYSGNMGLKDQQLALEWISKNIGHFGGDNKRITLFGHSAGGASTHYHILSSESRKYFRNAIPMSGSVLNYWALSPEKNHLSRIYRILKEELDEPKNSFEELLAFLKEAPAKLFNKFSTIEVYNYVRYTVPFGPIVERKDAIRPFILESPEKLYKTSKINVDTMFSLTNLEAMSLIPKTPASLLNALNANFNLPLPFNTIDLPLESDEHYNLSNQIRNFYFGDAKIDEQAIPKFFEYVSDFNFALGIDKSIKLHAKHTTAKSYYLWFSVDSTLNLFKRFDIFKRGDVLELPGAAHADDLCYLFRCGAAQSYYDQIIENKNDDQSKINFQTIDYITKLYTNFAKYGKPTHQNDPVSGFKPIHNEDIHFLDVNNDGLTTGLKPHQKVFDFWSNIEKQAKQAIQHVKQKRDEL